MTEFSIMTIGVFVAGLNEVVKLIGKTLGWKDVNRFIPIFSIVFGAMLGFIGYQLDNVDMGNNIVEAIFIGLAAGGSATGCHQIYKQMTKDGIDEDIEPDKPPANEDEK